jgi:hypothetical protein
MGLWGNGFVSLVLVVLTIGAVRLEVAQKIVGPVELAFQVGFVAHEMFAFFSRGDAAGADFVIEHRGSRGESGVDLVEMFQIIG